MKLGTYTNPDMKNLMVMFNFSVVEGKQVFWANLLQESKLSIYDEIWHLN